MIDLIKTLHNILELNYSILNETNTLINIKYLENNVILQYEKINTDIEITTNNLNGLHIIRIIKNKFEIDIDNLYDIFIDTGDRSLYSFKIITENLIYISGIFKCINKCNSTEQKCYYCENMDYLNTTSSPYCIINNIGNFNLLNNLSPNIKNLKINVGWVNFDKFELSNLPIFIEKLTIIYTNFIAPEKFYELCINKIKLPFKCKLKIIRHVDMNEVTTQNRFFQLE